MQSGALCFKCPNQHAYSVSMQAWVSWTSHHSSWYRKITANNSELRQRGEYKSGHNKMATHKNTRSWHAHPCTEISKAGSPWQARTFLITSTSTNWSGEASDIHLSTYTLSLRAWGNAKNCCKRATIPGTCPHHCHKKLFARLASPFLAMAGFRWSVSSKIAFWNPTPARCDLSWLSDHTQSWIPKCMWIYQPYHTQHNSTSDARHEFLILGNNSLSTTKVATLMEKPQCVREGPTDCTPIKIHATDFWVQYCVIRMEATSSARAALQPERSLSLPSNCDKAAAYSWSNSAGK